MGALSQFLTHLYTMTMIFFTILLLELIILLRSFARSICNSNDRPITTARYLELIEEKNPADRFSKTGSVWAMEPAEEECRVCLSMLEEGEEIRRLKCSHTFHKVCLDTWLQQDWATCPLCRTKVLPEEIVVKYRQGLNGHHDDQYDGSDEELIFLLSALHGNNLHRLL